MDYRILIFYGAVIVILASGVCVFLLIAYDRRRNPYCPHCGNSAHTYRYKIFKKNFHCSQHGMLTD